MIKKLRVKIAVINLILISIILLCALVVVFSVGFERAQDATEIALSHAIEDALRGEDFNDKSEYHNVVVVIFKDNVPQVFKQNNSDVTDNKAIEEASRIIDKHNGQSIITVSYKILAIPQTRTTAVAMANIFVIGGIGSYTLVSFMTLIVSLICFFIVSWLLASLALKPVEESWNQQKQFVADASHELKTPLSVISANMDIISSHKDETVASQMKWIENTKLETRRMAELVGDLLFLAKNDDGLIVEKNDLNFSDITSTMALSYESVLYENNKVFDHNIDSDIVVYGNQTQLMQLITILLDNANKYSLESGNISLLLKKINNKTVMLQVSNDSETLSDDCIRHIFDRFYTADCSRNKNTTGNGLGLAIAKLICTTHQGDIVVESLNNRTTFTATIPLAKEKKQKQK